MVFFDPPKPICTGCNKTPGDIEEYVDMAVEYKYHDVDAWVRRHEGTYNPENGHFLCTDCYVKAGMPSSLTGWKAP